MATPGTADLSVTKVDAVDPVQTGQSITLPGRGHQQRPVGRDGRRAHRHAAGVGRARVGHADPGRRVHGHGDAHVRPRLDRERRHGVRRRRRDDDGPGCRHQRRERHRDSSPTRTPATTRRPNRRRSATRPTRTCSSRRPTRRTPSRRARSSPTRVSVGNRGPASAANVVVADTLPAGTTFESASAPAGWSCPAPVAGVLSVH